MARVATELAIGPWVQGVRVALICPYSLDLPGGVQNQVRALAAELRSRGHEAVVVGPGVSEAPEGEIRLGKTVPTPGNGSVAPLLLNPARKRAFQTAIESADVLHVHEPALPALGWWATKSGIAQVHTFHADAPTLRGAVARQILSRLPKPAFSTAVSETAAANWGIPLQIIPNAVEVVARKIPRTPGQVVCIGRDEPRKGIDVLLAAWPAVKQAVPHAHLTLTTGGTSTNSITCVGLLTDHEKWDLLLSSEVAVAPNRFGESFGLVVAEAMAAGTPLVMSELPAFRAVAGGAAVAVPIGDSVALSTAIVALLNDPDERDRRSQAGIVAALRFGVEGVVDQYIDLFRAAAASP